MSSPLIRTDGVSQLLCLNFSFTGDVQAKEKSSQETYCPGTSGNRSKNSETELRNTYRTYRRVGTCLPIEMSVENDLVKHILLCVCVCEREKMGERMCV
jgi:hypothetical protein